MHIQLVVSSVQQPVSLRDLALRLVEAEHADNMELFQAHLRSDADVILVVQAIPAHQHMHALECFPITHVPHEEVRRIFHGRPQQRYREIEFRKGGTRSYLMRQKSKARARKK